MSDTVLLGERPAHVPEHLVVDFDFVGETRNGARWQAGTAEVFNRHGPIIWTPHSGGYWLIGGYEELLDMAQDPVTFSSDNTKYPPESMYPRNLPFFTDAPDHPHYRAPVVAAMTPGLINSMKAGIRDLARSLVAGFAADGRCDMVSQYTEILPISVVLDLLGLPTNQIREWRSLMPAILNSPTAEGREVVKRKIRDIVRPFIAERRLERKNDMISVLLDSRFEDRPFTDDELTIYVASMFTAGLDTVTNSMSFAIHDMAKNQELQAQLRADPGLIPLAIEEFLRRYSIVTFRRYVMQDVEFHGVTMKKYDRVAYVTAAGNLDPRVFANPLDIDLDRADPPHLAFLAGPHRCAGSHLARAEMTIAYEELLKGLPQFRLDPDVMVEPVTGWTFGLPRLPLVWAPAGK